VRNDSLRIFQPVQKLASHSSAKRSRRYYRPTHVLGHHVTQAAFEKAEDKKANAVSQGFKQKMRMNAEAQ
jgi:hypothetical protein